jgi:hypothetical protein
MKKKETKRGFSESDKFDRKQKKHAFGKQKDSKNKYSIYQDYDDEEELTDIYNNEDEEFEDE